jgi:hypothetical protein
MVKTYYIEAGEEYSSTDHGGDLMVLNKTKNPVVLKILSAEAASEDGWDYRVEPLLGSHLEIQKHLQQIGGDAWELVSVLTGPSTIAIFKRRIITASEEVASVTP